VLSPLGEQNDQTTRFGSQCFWFLIRRSFVIICGIVVVDQIYLMHCCVKMVSLYFALLSANCICHNVCGVRCDHQKPDPQIW